MRASVTLRLQHGPLPLRVKLDSLSPVALVFLFPLLLLPLYSCSGGEESCTTREIDALEICLADEWRELPESEMHRLKLTEETVATFSKGPVNLTVTREPLFVAINQLTYGEENMKSVVTLPGYQETGKEKIKTGAGKAWLHTFQTGDQKFLQLSLVSGSVGYTVTASMGEEEIEEEIIELLKSTQTVE